MMDPEIWPDEPPWNDDEYNTQDETVYAFGSSWHKRTIKTIFGEFNFYRTIPKYLGVLDDSDRRRGVSRGDAP